MAGTSKDRRYGIFGKNGTGGDSDSHSGCNLELTLGGGYSGGGDVDDEIPVLTLSSSVCESSDIQREGSGEPNVCLPEEFAVQRSFLSLRMSLPPAMTEMRTIKEMQTMRRREVKKRLMGRNRSRGRPPLSNHSQSRVLFPAIYQSPPPRPPPNSVPPSQPLCPTPLSFPQSALSSPPPNMSSPPLSPMPLAFRAPTPSPPPPSPLSPPPEHSSLQPPLPSHPHFPANGEGHKTATPADRLPVEILRALVVRWLLQHKYKRHRASDRSDSDTGLELIKKMPTVVATGAGPEGKRIEGFLCKFGIEEVSLVCICHGFFFTPAEFVKHAGGDDVQNPMKQIIVCPASF